MTQRELAREFGVTGAAIALWENGDRAVTGPIIRLVELYEAELASTERQQRTGPFRASSGLHLRRTSSGMEALLWFTLSRIITGDSSVASRVRMAAARRYVEAFGELKGLAMKFGQMVGYMSFVLPDDHARALARLTATARAASQGYIAAVVNEELGAPPRHVFREWGAEPIAVASIGQVHEAVTHQGVRVAVKIQHDRIVDYVLSDLKHVELLDGLYSRVFRGQIPGVFHREIHARMMEECDYLIEADNQRAFRDACEDLPDIIVPRVLDALTTRRVLTTELAVGRSIDELAQFGAQAERDAAATSIWRFFWSCCLRHGLYHTDPNPGNFIIGDGVVTVLDFGRIKRFSPDFVPMWKQLFRAMLERDRAGVGRTFDQMESLSQHEKYDLDYGFKSLVACFLPVVTKRPFHFTANFVRRSWRSFIVENVNLPLIHFTPDMVFLHQIQFGLSALMARLDASVACRDVFLDLLYEPDEARPSPFDDSELAALGLQAP